MRCSNCASENRGGKKFCTDCGAALPTICPKCGAENPATKRFCGGIGQALGLGDAVTSLSSGFDREIHRGGTPGPRSKVGCSGGSVGRTDAETGIWALSGCDNCGLRDFLTAFQRAPDRDCRKMPPASGSAGPTRALILTMQLGPL
jgi:hypothetical protein